MMKTGEIRKEILGLLDKGYSKSELARILEISRSTLINILNKKGFAPSKTIASRIQSNLEWIERTEENPMIEALTLLYFKHQNVQDYFKVVSEQAETITGFKLRYHGMTTGRPVGFLMLDSPGIEPVADIYSKCQEVFPKGSYGRTETMVISKRARYSGNHDEANIFYEKYPNARIYLLLFYSYSFTAKSDMANIEKIFVEPKYKDEVFLLEGGIITGRYDYFFLFIAKDEQAYHKFLSSPQGVYDVTNRSQTESTALTISPQGRPLFEEGKFNLSFSGE